MSLLSSTTARCKKVRKVCPQCVVGVYSFQALPHGLNRMIISVYKISFFGVIYCFNNSHHEDTYNLLAAHELCAALLLLHLFPAIEDI